MLIYLLKVIFCQTNPVKIGYVEVFLKNKCIGNITTTVNPTNWPKNASALISISSVTNFTIEGFGGIFGDGDPWWKVRGTKLWYSQMSLHFHKFVSPRFVKLLHQALLLA